MQLDLYYGDNLPVLRSLESGTVDLIYIDPPFNTGKVRTLHNACYEDSYEDYLAFLTPRLQEARRILKDGGSLFVHLDFREVHYVKVELDKIFGRKSFVNEIIWAYDYGARSKTRWSPKHDNILWYAKSPGEYCFRYDEIDRIPYMAPSLVGPEKAAKGKTLTDCWWCTIVPTNGKERVGYPTQKPLGILERIVRVHSNPGDLCLDFFAGSGSFGVAAHRLGRRCILVDSNPDAIRVMQDRFRSLGYLVSNNFT